MTIATETRRAGPYSGNGSTQVFAFSFKCYAAADLVVVTTTSSVDTIKTLTTHYTVSLNANQNTNPGGSITMLTAPATGTTLIITTDMAYLQDLALVNQGAFLPDAINDAADKLAIMIQQARYDLDRSPRGALSDAAWNRLPTAALRAGGLLGFDGDGQPIVADFDAVEAIATDIAAVAAIAAEIQIVADADVDVATVADNIGDVLTVANAVGDGTLAVVKDTYAALTAISAAERSAGMVVYVSARTTAGDGGEGHWRFDAASSATANGGTILAPDAGTGRWLRVVTNGIFVPAWWGTDGAALQSAISAAEASGGKVEVKSGTTSVAGTVVNDASRVWVEGQGIASVIEANSASITPVYRIGLAAGPGVTDNKLSSVKIGRSVASDAGQVGLEFGDWNNGTVRDVVIAEHGYGILVNGPTGSIGIQLAFENCMLYDCRDAFVWILGGAGVYFKGGEMGRNGVSESPQPRACIVIQGDSNDLRFEGMNVIPRRGGASTTDVLSFESYTNSTGYIVLDDFNCESVRSVIKTDASTPLVNGLIATGSRLTCDDNFFNQNAATTFQNWLISNCNISCSGFTATFGQWNTINAYIGSNVTLTLASTSDLKFGSRVTGNVSITGGGANSHLDLSGCIVTGNLTLAGTFGTVTGEPLVLGTFTDSATITNRRFARQDLRTAATPQFTGIELGNASDTTLTRSGPGRMAVEGIDVTLNTAAQTLTNKTFTDPAMTGTLTGMRFEQVGAASIAAIGNALNTTNKFQGRAVYDVNNHRIMVANGSAAADPWYVADGSASVTPS